MKVTQTVDVPGPRTLAEFEKVCAQSTPRPTPVTQNEMLKGVIKAMEEDHGKVCRGYSWALVEAQKTPATSPTTSPTKAPEKPATASAHASAPTSAPDTPGAFSTLAEALAEYNKLPENAAREREAFRQKHARVLGLGAGDTAAANETFESRAEAEAAYRRLDQSDAYGLQDFREKHARILGLTRTSGGSGFNR